QIAADAVMLRPFELESDLVFGHAIVLERRDQSDGLDFRNLEVPGVDGPIEILALGVFGRLNDGSDEPLGTVIADYELEDLVSRVFQFAPAGQVDFAEIRAIKAAVADYLYREPGEGIAFQGDLGVHFEFIPLPQLDLFQYHGGSLAQHVAHE